MCTFLAYLLSWDIRVSPSCTPDVPFSYPSPPPGNTLNVLCQGAWRKPRLARGRRPTPLFHLSTGFSTSSMTCAFDPALRIRAPRIFPYSIDGFNAFPLSSSLVT